MPSASISGNIVICKETMIRPLKVSDHKMLGAVIVGNLVICNKIVKKAPSRAMAFLGMKQQKSILFWVCSFVEAMVIMDQ